MNDTTDTIDDDELTRLALEADPDAPLDPDAVPIWDVLGEPAAGLLPPWYMAAPSGGRRRWSRRRRIVVLTLIVAFLTVDAYGLRSTYGYITIA